MIIKLHAKKCCGSYNDDRSHRTSNGWVKTSHEYTNYYFTTDCDNFVISFKERTILSKYIEQFKDEESYDTDMPEWHEETIIPIEELVSDLNSCQLNNTYTAAKEPQKYFIKDVLAKVPKDLSDATLLFNTASREKYRKINEAQNEFCSSLLYGLEPYVKQLVETKQIDPASPFLKTNIRPADYLLFNNDLFGLIRFIITNKVEYDDLHKYFRVLFPAKLYSCLTSGEDITYLDIINKRIKGFETKDASYVSDLVRTLEIRDANLIGNAVTDIVSIALIQNGFEIYGELKARSEIIKNNYNQRIRLMLSLAALLDGDFDDVDHYQLKGLLTDKLIIGVPEKRLLKRISENPSVIEEFISYEKEFSYTELESELVLAKIHYFLLVEGEINPYFNQVRDIYKESVYRIILLDGDNDNTPRK